LTFVTDCSIAVDNRNPRERITSVEGEKDSN
jgi:hypothetical protein